MDEFSEFKEKYDLLEAILANEGLAFRDDMTRKERNEMSVKRDAFLSRTGFHMLSLTELREVAREFLASE